MCAASRRRISRAHAEREGRPLEMAALVRNSFSSCRTRTLMISDRASPGGSGGRPCLFLGIQKHIGWKGLRVYFFWGKKYGDWGRKLQVRWVGCDAAKLTARKGASRIREVEQFSGWEQCSHGPKPLHCKSLRRREKITSSLAWRHKPMLCIHLAIRLLFPHRLARHIDIPTPSRYTPLVEAPLPALPPLESGFQGSRSGILPPLPPSSTLEDRGWMM